MLFQLDFGCIVHGERWTGWLEPGSGAPTAGHAPLPASLSQQQHNLPCALGTTLSQDDPPSHGFICRPQFPSPLPVSTGAYIIRDCINSLLIRLQTWVSVKLLNRLYMSQLIKHIWGFIKATSCWGFQDVTWTIFCWQNLLKLKILVLVLVFFVFCHRMRMSVLLEKEKSKKPFNGL